MQGLGEQRREPLSEESLVAAYTVGRHFAESMRILMQESSDVILRHMYHRCPAQNIEMRCTGVQILAEGIFFFFLKTFDTTHVSLMLASCLVLVMGAYF